MGCEDIRPLLKAFLDRELDLPRRELIERHLEVCASCREVLRDYRELSILLGSGVPDVPSPPREIVESWARLASEETRTTVCWLRRVAAVAASLLVASLVAFWSLSWHSGEEADAFDEAAFMHRENAVEIVLSDPSWGEGEF